MTVQSGGVEVVQVSIHCSKQTACVLLQVLWLLLFSEKAESGMVQYITITLQATATDGPKIAME